MDIFILVIMSAVIGLIVGMLSGLLGIGGGTILVAIFKLAYGLPATVATATSLFTIIPTSFSGAITHLKNKTCILSLGVAAGIGGACTSPLGVWLASISPDWVIMTAAALVIAYSAITMFSKAMKLRKTQKSQPLEEGEKKEALGNAEQKARTEASLETSGAASNSEAEPSKKVSLAKTLGISMKKLVGFGAGIGAVAGVMSGFIGVGGGFLMVPLFMQLLNTPMKLTSGTSLIAVMILAIPGTITNAAMGNIEWVAGIFVAIGAIPGAILGSRFITKVPEFQLRLLFSAFLIVVAIMLVVDQLGIL